MIPPLTPPAIFAAASRTPLSLPNPFHNVRSMSDIPRASLTTRAATSFGSDPRWVSGNPWFLPWRRLRRGMRQMESPLKTYSKIVDKHPLLGKIGTSVLLITLADVIQQCLEISKRERAPGGVATFGERARDLRDNFDWGRTSRVIAWTGLFGTPICHKWFPMLEKIIPLKGQGAPLIKRVAGRVALDQVVCSPFLTAGFLGFMSVAESGVFDGAVVESKIKDALPVLLPLSWAVWAPVHMLTFSVVPDRMRMLWIGSINLVWGTVMSSYSVTKPPAPSLRLDAPAPPGLLLPVPDAQDTLSASAEVLDAEPLFAHPSGFVLNTEVC
mmetsp:Transcript_43024/g.101166  ORF Transcript_43024/g.101166 Transcript_43024/m.101166 type:complete len:327 (+) Transcript_43024:135-1115(+)